MVVTPEVSKLSGWLNAPAFCRELNGGHAVRCELRAWRRRAAGDRGARSVQGRARLQIGSRARGGAHVEHAVHGCDAGGVEAQRLWLNADAPENIRFREHPGASLSFLQLRSSHYALVKESIKILAEDRGQAIAAPFVYIAVIVRQFFSMGCVLGPVR